MRLRYQLALLTASRVVFNTSVRMIYPFLAVFARGMGVGIPAISLAVSVRSAVGALVPVTNSALDRFPRRTALAVGAALFAVGCALVAIRPGYLTFFIALSLAMLGANLFGTSSQAYIGDTVPYHLRGRVMGLQETSWALSFLIGVPLIGLLLARFGWPSPFLALGVLALMVVIAVRFALPGSRSGAPPPTLQGEQSDTRAPQEGALHNLGQVFHSPAALAGLGVAVAVASSMESVNIVFGVWMESSFSLKIAALGSVAIILGIGDLLGELSSGVLSDWLGKAQAVRIGLVLMALAALLLPVAGSAQWAATAAMFMFFFSFDLAFVSCLSLMTEVLPSARATLMGAISAAYSAGLMIGALIGPLAYHWGILYNGLISAILAGLALVALERVQHGVTNGVS
jgi:predicted MFS family arabinose efflux permease